MKMLNGMAFEEIRAWVYRNARPIELVLWEYEFESGSQEAVLSALSHYQNKDGGFGHALEPDCWNPHSSPYTTLNAIGKLKAIHFSDITHPMVQGIFRFLESGAHSCDNGWLFSIPSNDDYPHAPWWSYHPKTNEAESTGVTAGLVCFLLRLAPKESSLYKKAFGLAGQLLSRFNSPARQGDMGLSGYCDLLDTIKQLKLADRLDISYLSTNIKGHIDEAIVRDVPQWAHYCVRPSQFIQSPDSPFYPGNEDIVRKELDYLIDTRPENGTWDITWHWHDHYEKYPEAFAVSKNWWKADLDTGAIGKIKFLRRFDRLGFSSACFRNGE